MRIVTEFAEVLERTSESLGSTGAMVNPPSALPYPKATIADAIRTVYAHSAQTGEDKALFGTLYMALGIFGTFANESEAQAEIDRWAREWFWITEGVTR